MESEFTRQITPGLPGTKAADASARELTLGNIAPVAIRLGRVQWRVRSSATLSAVRHVLCEPDAFLADEKSLLKNAFRTTIGRVHSSVSAHEGWVLRRINYNSRLSVVRDFFRASAPMRSFRASLALEQAGIPTPRVLAAGILRVMHKPVKGYLLAQDLTPVQSLAEWLRRPGRPSRDLIHRVAEAIARLHEGGFVHGDLTINNILLDEHGCPWFVDLDRTRHSPRPVGWREAVEDFHRLARHVGRFRPATQRAALQLLKDYCAWRGWTGRERSFVEAVFKRLRHKLAAHQKV